MASNKAWPPKWLICGRCGEAVKRELMDAHGCRPKSKRPPDLLKRWHDRRVRREIEAYLELHDVDPAFDPARQQRDFYQP